jgi:hypothetical protein
MQVDEKVPSVVEREALEAEELFKKLFETQEEDDEDALKENEKDEQGSDNNDADNESSKNVSVDDDTSDKTENTPTDEDDFKKWKERYLSLKGKYDAEVPRLSHELKELKESLSATLNREEEDFKKKEKEKEEEELRAFQETYGEEFTQKVKKLIEKQVEDHINPYKQEIEAVKEDQTKKAQLDFMKELDEKASGWRDLWSGKDPEFKEFLNQTDPSGLYTYQELITMYNTKWDAEKLAKVFNIYLEQKNQTKEKQNQSRSSKELRVPDNLTNPSRSTSASTPQDKSKKIWSESDIAKFMHEERTGKYSAEEAEKIWDDILSAPMEGRVR